MRNTWYNVLKVKTAEVKNNMSTELITLNNDSKQILFILNMSIFDIHVPERLRHRDVKKAK
jgi:hypothetical protein